MSIEIYANGIMSKITYNSQIGAEELAKVVRYDVARAVENEHIHNRIFIDGETVFNNERTIKEVYDPLRKEVRDMYDKIPYKEFEARCAVINAKIKEIKAAKIEELTAMILARFDKPEIMGAVE